MKKLAALVLALILALAAIPALGEGADYSGTWCLNMAGMTMGNIELGAEDKLVWTLPDQTVEGTWEATEAGVKISLLGDTIELVACEEGLTNEAAGIKLTRESEKVDLNMLINYLQTKELPEGVTQEDIDAAITGLQGIYEEVQETAEAVEEKAEEVTEEATEAVEEAVETVEEKAEEVAEEATEAVEGAAEAVEEKAEEVAEEATEAVESAVEAVEEKAEEVTEEVTEAVEGAAEAVEEKAEEVAEEATEAVEGAVEAVEEKAEEVTEEVTEAVEGAAEAVEEVTEAVEEAVKAPMTHEEYVAAEKDAEVVVFTYVQAHQNWWENKVTVYAQSPDGAYFIYEMACSEEDAAKLVAGTPILVKGYKGEWSGEVEILDATFEFPEGENEPWIAEPEDVTAKLGTDELIGDMNKLVAFKGLTVEAYDENGAAFAYKNAENLTDDLYFKASRDGQVYDFCIEFYLCGKDTDVYKAVEALNVGDVIDMEGFLYWYNGANPHVTKVTPAE